MLDDGIELDVALHALDIHADVASARDGDEREIVGVAEIEPQVGERLHERRLAHRAGAKFQRLRIG